RRPMYHLMCLVDYMRIRVGRLENDSHTIRDAPALPRPRRAIDYRVPHGQNEARARGYEHFDTSPLAPRKSSMPVARRTNHTQSVLYVSAKACFSKNTIKAWA